jgi:hypothetical protein
MESHAIVDETIRRYLTDKVREKFPEDFYLIESSMHQLVERYSLKELFMICSVEINRHKNARGTADHPDRRGPGQPAGN